MLFGNSKIVCFVSSKGGVGKTLITAEVALSLSSQGKKVLILDGDFGLSNIDIFFSVKTKGNLQQVIQGDKTLKDIITPLGSRMDLISSGNGMRFFNTMTGLEKRGLVSSLLDLQSFYDFILIDTSSGLSDFTFHIASLSHLIVNILTPDPSSFTDSYSLIKILNQDFKIDRFCLLTNFVPTEMAGALLFKKFMEVSGRFLSLSFDYLGSLTFDSEVLHYTQNQKIYLRYDSQSPHKRQMTKVTQNLVQSSSYESPLYHPETERRGIA
jgi:flagellar biosynthesis protein FlhG